LADIIDKVSYLVNQPVAGLFEFGTLHIDDRISFPEHRQFLVFMQ
jgi:hypothetical protein